MKSNSFQKDLECDEVEVLALSSPRKSLQANICRICLDSQETPETGSILQPCHCKGSIAYVHSNCLKKAIKLMEKYVGNGCCCEICGEEYKMKIKIRRSFTCRKLDRDRLDSFANLILFIGLTFMLFCLGASEVDKLLTEINSAKNDKLNIIIPGVSIGLFSLTLAIFIYVIYYLVIELFWRLEIYWRIYDYDAVVEKDPKLKEKLSKLRSGGRSAKKSLSRAF